MPKTGIKISPFLALIYLSGFHVTGQPTLLKHQKSIPASNPTAISKDRNGYIYIANDTGDIIQYDSNGNQTNTYSPDKPGEVTLIEAWSALRILIFYADFQEYLLLDRFLNASPHYQISNEGVGFSSLLTLAEDNNLWIVDNENLNLIKFDKYTNQVLINTSLNNYILIEDNTLNFIKAYQQQIFINDAASGILVFDNFGNYVKKLPITGLAYFNFLKDELYYLSNGAINFINLYSLKERTIPLDSKVYDKVLLVDNNAFLIGKEAVDIYKLDGF